MLVQVTAIIMLRKPDRDMAFGDEASWHFIETVLTVKMTAKLVYTLSKVKMPLARLNAECIKVGSERSRELCLLLRNIKPNMG